ncbi:hypothetical protein AD998_12370 [bacterium 336/3]|nr:hypothetical protein AD998_12370 [bacterium 336/3]
MKAILFFFLFISSNLLAQKITLTGKVADNAQESLIGVSVYLASNKKIGTVTNEEGVFRLTFDYIKDSLVIEYVGYVTKKITFTRAEKQNFTITLEEDKGEIEGISVTPGENPAWAIIRKVIKNKDKNDKRSLQAYECDTYNRIEGYVNNNEKGLSNLRVMKDMTKVAEKTPALRDSKGKVIVPILVSESFSKYYYQGKPEKEREDVKATNLTGLGLEDAQGFGQILTGGKLNEYNFYRNQMNILDKYFTSPIADGWRLKYDYDLMDSVWVDKDFCYVINLVPRSEQDLAFVGKMWITKEDYAIKKIEVEMNPKANINFIKNLKIKQEMERTQQGAWVPKNIDFQVEISDFSELIPNIYVRAKTMHQNYIINQLKEKEFYNTLPLPPENEVKDEKYWLEYRKNDSTLTSQINVYKIIDSLKTIPSVKRYTTALMVLSTGYYEMNGLDLGHYARYYAWNDIEGHRPGMGFRTNYLLSKNFTLKGRLGYGFTDKKLKYHVEVSQVVSRKNFTQVGIKRTEEIEPTIQLNTTDPLPELFVASNRFFTLSTRKPFMKKETILWVESKVSPSLTERLYFQNRTLIPVHPFAYRVDANSDLQTNITVSEMILQSSFRKGGNRVRLLDNSEINLGGSGTPRITFTGMFGFKGIAGGQFNYQRVSLDISQYNARVFGIGHANYAINAGYIFGKLPFPLLRVHLGNNTPIMIERAFNQMNGFEFVSDHYVALHYAHFFEGLFFNRLPLLKKANKFLDWRLVLSLNAVYGGMRDENKAMLSNVDIQGNTIEPIQSLDYKKPYVEVGYGVDNILKFFRVDFFHRLTYLDRPNAKPFGIKISAQIKL